MDRKRANPFKGLVDTMSEMERMRRLGTTGYHADYEEGEHTEAHAWVPAADIFAKGEDLVVWMELPGQTRESIDITFSGGVLTISGERANAPEGEDVTFWTRERYDGPFRRSITLPEGVDESRISASSEDGLLAITVLGACAVSTSQPRRISIGGGLR